MTILELLVFLLLCLVLGLLGRGVSHRWGWLAGAVPAGAVMVILMIAEVRSLMRAVCADRVHRKDN